MSAVSEHSSFATQTPPWCLRAPEKVLASTYSFHFCFQTEGLGGVDRGGSLLQGQAWLWDPAAGDKGPLGVKQLRASGTCMVYNRYLSGIINCIFPKFNIARRGKSFRLVKPLLPHSFYEPARFNCCDKNHKKDQVPTQSITTSTEE